MNEERFAAETKKIQSVIAKASQKAGALSALSDGGKMNLEKLQLTLEETAYFFESATLYLRALCETQMPGTEYTPVQAQQDGKLITGQAPGASFAFGLKLLAALRGEQTAADVAEGMVIRG